MTNKEDRPTVVSGVVTGRGLTNCVSDSIGGADLGVFADGTDPNVTICGSENLREQTYCRVWSWDWSLCNQL